MLNIENHLAAGEPDVSSGVGKDQNRANSRVDIGLKDKSVQINVQ